MTISSVIDTPVAAPINTTNNTGTKATNDVGADQDKFMKLLVTQLKNQDPLNPMDNAAMTSQLAQLSTVTGINKVNATLESLRTDISNTQSSTAISLIGKGILVEGKGIELNSSTDADSVTTPAESRPRDANASASSGPVLAGTRSFAFQYVHVLTFESNGSGSPATKLVDA